MLEMQHPLGNMMREVISNRSFVALLALSALLAIVGQSETRLFVPQYLASSKPNQYPNGAEIPIWILPLTSVDAQLTLEYDESLFCSSAESSSAIPPSKWIVDTTNPTLPSSIKVWNNDGKTNHPRQLCQKTLDQEQAQALQKLIESDYRFNLAIDDGLPAACTLGRPESHRYYHGGCPIGFTATSTDGQLSHYIFTHLKLQVLVNSKDQVVGFNIQPESIQNLEQLNQDTVEARSKVNYKLVAPNDTISFTYQVEVSKMELEWSQRWRIYLSEDNYLPSEVHYRGISDGVMIVVFMGVLFVYQWTKRVAVDAKLEQPLLPCTIDDEAAHLNFYQNWKLLDQDVFRPPSNPMLLCVACGTGAQILSTAVLCCLACFFGIMSPVYKRTLFVGFLAIYALVGSWVGGYVTAKTYQDLQMSQGKQRAIYNTTLLFPALLLTAFFGVNAWSLKQGATYRPLYPDGFMVVTAMGVFLVQSLRGANYGFAHAVSPFPAATATVAREIPVPKNWWYRWGFPAFLSVWLGMTLSSISLVENTVLLTYFWHGQYFDTFGYLLVVLVIMVACSAAFGVESTFIRLNQENHHWWWSSFMGGASTGFFFLVYYWFQAPAMNVGQTAGTAVYYYAVTLIASVGVALSFGFVSVACSLYFVRRIYGALNAGL